MLFNPVTYGILTFRQLRSGLFGPDPENKVFLIIFFCFSLQRIIILIVFTMSTQKRKTN